MNYKKTISIESASVAITVLQKEKSEVRFAIQNVPKAGFSKEAEEHFIHIHQEWLDKVNAALEDITNSPIL